MFTSLGSVLRLYRNFCYNVSSCQLGKFMWNWIWYSTTLPVSGSCFRCPMSVRVQEAPEWCPQCPLCFNFCLVLKWSGRWTLIYVGCFQLNYSSSIPYLNFISCFASRLNMPISLHKQQKKNFASQSMFSLSCSWGGSTKTFFVAWAGHSKLVG